MDLLTIRWKTIWICDSLNGAPKDEIGGFYNQRRKFQGEHAQIGGKEKESSNWHLTSTVGQAGELLVEGASVDGVHVNEKGSMKNNNHEDDDHKHSD
jgi:hypothetical protein